MIQKNTAQPLFGRFFDVLSGPLFTILTKFPGDLVGIFFDTFEVMSKISAFMISSLAASGTFLMPKKLSPGHSHLSVLIYSPSRLCLPD